MCKSMLPKSVVVLLVFGLLLSACVAPAQPQATPGAQLTSLPSDTPGAKPTVAPSAAAPTVAPTAAPTAAPTLAPTGLPAPLYILVRSLYHTEGPENQGVWRLDPRAAQVQRVTAAGVAVSSFAVSADGRIAYGTKDGKIFTAAPGAEAALLFDTAKGLDYPVAVIGLAWSPDGKQLAYTVFYASEQLRPSSELRATGLWLLNVESGAATQLVYNRYLEDRENVNDVRVLSDPVWSPDGQALKMQGNFWEWTDVLWMMPVAPDLEGEHLRTAAGNEDWAFGNWSQDGKSLLLSGALMSTISSAMRVQRDATEPQQLVDPTNPDLYVTNAYESPSGIAFLGTRPETTPPQLHLYVNALHGDPHGYKPAGPDRSLCPEGYAAGGAWTAAGDAIAISCPQGQLVLVSLDGKTDLDLTPLLGPLANQDARSLYWAPLP